MAASARAFTVGGIALLVAGLVPLLAPFDAAAEETLRGHDVSWPQCPSAASGNRLVMPPVETQFVILGLTRGLPFTENPCLADQVAWVRQNSKPAHGYTIPAFPTDDQIEEHAEAGPWSGSGRADQLRNVGYAQARFALDSLRRVDFAPPMVWIDVEPRPKQPWPTATPPERLENRLIIEGVMRGLDDADMPYGLYSYASGWQLITDSWSLPDVPVWATAGRLDYPTEAHDRCTQPSFSGGPRPPVAVVRRHARLRHDVQARRPRADEAWPAIRIVVVLDRRGPHSVTVPRRWIASRLLALAALMTVAGGLGAGRTARCSTVRPFALPVLVAREQQCRAERGHLPNLVAVNRADVGALQQVVDDLNGV